MGNHSLTLFCRNKKSFLTPPSVGGIIFRRAGGPPAVAAEAVDVEADGSGRNHAAAAAGKVSLWYNKLECL